MDFVWNKINVCICTYVCNDCFSMWIRASRLLHECPYLFLTCASSCGRPKLFISFMTSSDQLFPLSSDINLHGCIILDQSESSSHSTRQTRLDVRGNWQYKILQLINSTMWQFWALEKKSTVQWKCHKMWTKQGQLPQTDRASAFVSTKMLALAGGGGGPPYRNFLHIYSWSPRKIWLVYIIMCVLM